MLCVCYYENRYHSEQFLSLALKNKPKVIKCCEIGSVFPKQGQQKVSISYKYLCFSNNSEEIQNLTQKVGKLELKLEEEKIQMTEDTVENLNKVQLHFCLCFSFFLVPDIGFKWSW